MRTTAILVLLLTWLRRINRSKRQDFFFSWFGMGLSFNSHAQPLSPQCLEQ